MAAIALVSLLIAGCGGGSSTGHSLPPLHQRSSGPVSMFTSATEILNNPAGITATLKALGVQRVHVPLWWDVVAPDSRSVRKPAVDLTNPANYPASGWAPYDAIVRDLRGAGIGIDLAITAPPPRWASAPGAPHPATQTEWEPSAADYGQFVRAVARRYSGHYTPPGASHPLPRVDFWSIWNEPNIGINIAPEAIDHSQVEVAPRFYRQFVDAAWSAFAATGHGHDTVLIGELAPAGSTTGAGPGNFNSMAPLRFLRALYCVDSSYRPLRGTAATDRGCPATAAGSAQFAAQNPGLFHASGFANHPYLFTGGPPNQPSPGEPDFTQLPDVGKLETVLDRLQSIYGSTTRFPIWDTEFGYQTKPPDPGTGTVSQSTAAYYDNWAEYLTWLDPRQASFDQYLLLDPCQGYFATGLESCSGAPKPGLAAYRLPIYLPVTSAASGQPLNVWGCARPAPPYVRQRHHGQIVDIQYARGSAGAFATVQTVAIGSGSCYFEVRVRFPGSGQVRLAWKYPNGIRVFSRTVDISLR